MLPKRRARNVQSVTYLVSLWITSINFLNKQDGQSCETIYALMERNYLILSAVCFKKKESNSIWVKQWNILTFWCDEGCFPLIQSVHDMKERQGRHELCITGSWIVGSCIVKPDNPFLFSLKWLSPLCIYFLFPILW